MSAPSDTEMRLLHRDVETLRKKRYCGRIANEGPLQHMASTDQCIYLVIHWTSSRHVMDYKLFYNRFSEKEH